MQIERLRREHLTPLTQQQQDNHPWAQALGRDQFGVWADIVVSDVRQRLRWCPPGKFIMGSPKGEAERYDDEGPETPITFMQGFWMFDTVVTQGMYAAVMGNNPSHFIDPNHPVEQVSWEDVQVFLAQLNDLFPGPNFTLPSEAQWEYACRGGSSTRYFWGDEWRPDLANADGKEGKTTPVRQYPANRWGLHDMHGNVWEWCADIWSPNHGGAATDGTARTLPPEGGGRGKGEDRHVVRGGSWIDSARDCRSAFRDADGPAYRDRFLGFRLVGGQASRAQAKARGTRAHGYQGQAEPDRGTTQSPVTPGA